MEELYFDKLGNFTEQDCKNIKKMMDGSTFYNYNVGWSNWAGNCALIVKADCSAEDKERAKGMLVYSAIGKGAAAFSLADFLVRYGNAHIKRSKYSPTPLVCEKRGDFYFFYFQDVQVLPEICDKWHEFTDEYGRICASVSKKEFDEVLESEAERQGYDLIVMEEL